jgi:AraC-like DNA-binding protein
MSFHSPNEVYRFFDGVGHLNDAPCGRDVPISALILVQSGVVTISNGTARSELNPKECGLVVGDASLITIGQSAMTNVVGCAISETSIKAPEGPKGSVLISKVPASAQLRTLFQLGFELKDAVSAENIWVRNAIGEAVFAAYAACGSIQSGLRLPPVVRRVCAYIDANYNETCDLSQLSKIARVSRGHLSSEFRKHLGKSPVRYLWEVRTQKAVEKIKLTSLGLVEVAAQCGYKSHFHLSREVKSLTGFSPKELRHGDIQGRST